MSDPGLSAMSQRHEQIFPILSQGDIEHLRRFGETQSFAAGDTMFKVGEVPSGLVVILSGKVRVTEGFGQTGKRPSSSMRPANSWENWRNFPLIRP